jgi:riboflavin synthase
MFTGLIESLGVVQTIADDSQGGRRLTIEEPVIAPQLTVGESVAVNGVCLTALNPSHGCFAFDVGPETLLRSNLGQLAPGQRVNLERSLRVGDRLGGHFVQGHVDAVGQIVERQRQGEWEMLRCRCPATLSPLMVSKGSIAVDGVSLTLVDVDVESFTVMLIPHTLAATTLGFKRTADTVNLETDMIAKHIQKLLGIDPSRRVGSP